MRRGECRSAPRENAGLRVACEHDGKHASRRQCQGLVRPEDRARRGMVLWASEQGPGSAPSTAGLQNENMARDADEKAGRHWNGQKVSDEA